ncbi:MAG: YgjV family protein [Pseudohongiella sp.]|nr:YgjV family protein [Pseudohongiella sp.]
MSEASILWLAYLIGAIGIIVEWRSYVLYDAHAFRRWSAAGAVLWGLMYLLLGAWTAAITMSCTAARTLVSGLLTSAARKHFFAGLFVSTFALMTILSWQGPVSLLPGFAVINTTLALFYLENRSMRIVMIASSLAWIINDIIWQAWPALLAESVAVLLNWRTISTMDADGGNKR